MVRYQLANFGTLPHQQHHHHHQQPHQNSAAHLKHRLNTPDRNQILNISQVV
jgi:hypothetical protein